MASELIDNQQISCKTDIFSLGIIMIKILTQSDETPTENVRIFTLLTFLAHFLHQTWNLLLYHYKEYPIQGVVKSFL